MTALLRGCLVPAQLGRKPKEPLAWHARPSPPSLPLPSHEELPDTPKQAMHCHTSMPLSMPCPSTSHAFPSPLSLPAPPPPHPELNPAHCLGPGSNVTLSGKPFPVLPVKKIITLPVGSLNPGLTVRSAVELSQSHPHGASAPLSIKWRQVTST